MLSWKIKNILPHTLSFYWEWKASPVITTSQQVFKWIVKKKYFVLYECIIPFFGWNRDVRRGDDDMVKKFTAEIELTLSLITQLTARPPVHSCAYYFIMKSKLSNVFIILTIWSVNNVIEPQGINYLTLHFPPEHLSYNSFLFTLTNFIVSFCLGCSRQLFSVKSSDKAREHSLIRQTKSWWTLWSTLLVKKKSKTRLSKEL